LLTSVATLVSQPLVVSSGAHVAKPFWQKHVLLDWQMPFRLHGSARARARAGLAIIGVSTAELAEDTRVCAGCLPGAAHT